MRKYLLLLTLLLISPGISLNNDINTNLNENDTAMPNIIYMIGDGMGPEEIKLASLVEYGNFTGNIMDLEFDWNDTFHTDDINGELTDSAASGTALASGKKTVRGIIGKNADETMYIENILEYLKYNFNYKTGIVTTTEISHATPAAFSAHVDDRDYKEEILQQQMKLHPDVLLGAGKGIPYIGSDTSVRQLGIDNNYDTAITRDELLSLANTSNSLLGIFNDNDGIPYELERRDDFAPSLIDMTSSALNLLRRQNNPYFLMIEGGRIDHAGHLSNSFSNKTLYNAMETIIFEKSIRLAVDVAKEDGNTIIIVTADHETGGLQIIDYSNLNSEIPNQANTELQNNILRVARVSNITVSWQGSSHTKTPSPFYAYGFNNKIPINENTDPFWAIVNELGAFPIFDEATIKKGGNKLYGDFIVKDIDASANYVSLIVESGSSKIEDRMLLENFNGTASGRVTVDISGLSNYIAYLVIEDNKNNHSLSVTSFTKDLNLITRNIEIYTPPVPETTETSIISTNIQNTTTTQSSVIQNSTTLDDANYPSYLVPILLIIITRKKYTHKK